MIQTSSDNTIVKYDFIDSFWHIPINCQDW